MNDELVRNLATILKVCQDHNVESIRFLRDSLTSVTFHPPAPATVPAPPPEEEETQRTDTELAALALAGRRRAPQQNEGG